MREQLVDIFGGPVASVGGSRRWLGITLLLVVLGAVEIGGVAVVGHALLPEGAAFVLDALGLVLVLGCVAATLSVLVRRHRIDESEVRLVLGVLGDARVAWSDVDGVDLLPALAPIEEDGTGPVFAGDALVLTAATGVPRVRVVLARPITARRLWQRRPVHEIVVSVARLDGD